MTPTFLETAGAFRAWLKRHHATQTESDGGFRTSKSGLASITYGQALDEALCVGWIDGVRKNLDATSYLIRFTPRKPGSRWSRINIAHVERLKAAGRMTEAGLKAFEGAHERPTRYAYDQAKVEFAPEDLKQLREHPEALAFFERQPVSYRKPVIWWVISAKREETRARRLEKLIAESAAGRRLL